MTSPIGIRRAKLLITSYIYNYNLKTATNINIRMIQSSNKTIVHNAQHINLALGATKNYRQNTTAISIKSMLLKLQQLFGISHYEAKELLKAPKKIKKCSSESLEENYNICMNNGIAKETLQKYVVILTLDNIEKRIKCLSTLSVDINLFAPILLANEQVIKRIVDDSKSEEHYVPYGNRIIYISKLLNLPATEVCEKLVDHLFILRMPLDRLESTLKVLLEYGIEPKNIMTDCWALRYSSKVAEERLKRAIQADVSKVKTWMIRCPNSVFERCLNRQVENRKILGSHSTVEEYLSQRLECSIENAKYLTEKNPALLKMNILKMKEILDYLYDQGYTSAHVCRVPRILIHSLETTKQRIQQLKHYGYIPPSLAILCKSKRDFDKALKKYKKLKKIAEDRQAKSELIEN